MKCGVCGVVYIWINRSNVKSEVLHCHARATSLSCPRMRASPFCTKTKRFSYPSPSFSFILHRNQQILEKQNHNFAKLRQKVSHFPSQSHPKIQNFNEIFKFFKNFRHNILPFTTKSANFSSTFYKISNSNSGILWQTRH